MLFDFKLPDIGEGVHEATILEWKCAPGDAVQEGDILAVAETDKVTAEIPSPRSGVIRRLGAEAGTSIEVGATFAQIETAGPGDEGGSVVGRLESTSSMLESSPEGKPPPAAPQNGNNRNRKVKATPVARRLAAQEDIDLATLTGSGPAGRILKDDILRALGGNREEPPQARGPSASSRPSQRPAATDGRDAPGGARELSTLRKTMARNLEASWKIPAALVHDFTVVDDLVETRRSLNRDAETTSYPRMSYLPFFIKAAAVSLRSYPLLNSWYDEETQVLETHRAINVGFAVDSREGLVVPVIAGADNLSLSEIQQLIDQRREAATNRSLSIESLRGGTFTVSNYGSIGGTYGRPLLLPPQVAILGIGKIHKAPVVVDGELAAATILPLSLVFDHRACDGAYAVRFLNRFIELVSKPIRILR
jgi:pyruvate dehydrogenase E2 component (dihydrolipoamide acetyltransferase)